MADYKSKHTGAAIDEAVDRVLNNAPQDGFSPIVTIDTITDGHRVNIRDKNGTKSFDVMDGEAGQDGKTPVKGVDYFDGEDGQDGAAGVSPTVTASKSGKVTTVTIKDVSGTKTATINDGEDGVGVANIYQKTTSLDDGGENVFVVELTDSTSANFKVRNGRRGADGKTPVKGVDYFDGAPGTDGKTPVKGVDYFDGQDGAAGKTAYQYAQDGGYTGTEAEFAEMLANGAPAAVGLEPADDDVPKVFLTGAEFSNMTADKNEVNMELEYRSKTKQFKAYILIKYQGRSSLSKPKKNFTIKMYKDEARESKMKMAFKDWGFEKHKYVLKANFIDHTHARNIIGANLWSEVVASRSDYDVLPEELRNSPRNGAVDGFPVKLYVNGTYQGVYTWNIGKDDWMWDMDEDNPNHVLLSNEGDQGSAIANAGNFRKVWNGVDGSHWSIEVGTNSDALKTSVNNLITFIMNNDGAAFRNGIGTHLDVQSAIDYYIHQYVICNIDSLSLNMLLATYDGAVWRCGAYDMDSTFGLWWTGEKFLPTDYKCPEDYQDKFSLLWERLEANYWPEIQARYAELRQTVYTPSNMFTHFERFMDVIGLDLYVEDLEVYPTIPSGSTANIKQLRNFIRDRLVYCDSQITNGIPGTAVALSASELTISVADGGTAKLTATKTPSNATDDVWWYSSNTAVATVTDGTVKGVGEGNCTIYAKCGSGYASCAVAVTAASEPDIPDTPAYTNLVPTSVDTDGSIYNGAGYKDGYRLSSSGGVSGTALSTATHTGFIPVAKGDIIRIKIVDGWTPPDGAAGNYVNFYTSGYAFSVSDNPKNWTNGTYGTTETLADGSTLITGFTANMTGLSAGFTGYFRVSFNPAKGANLIITVNQEIT